MRRTTIVCVLALLGCAASAAAQPAGDIAPGAIVGVALGTTRAKATAMLVKPVRLDRLEGGYERLVSGAQKVEVYFRTGKPGAVAITTWSRKLRTDRHVGPCTGVAALRRAYGSSLRPIRQGGTVVAYRFGDLVFTVEDGRRVGVVALGRGAAATYLALNAPACVGG